jgi:hypothetical protein
VTGKHLVSGAAARRDQRLLISKAIYRRAIADNGVDCRRVPTTAVAPR